jgi:hypothetical protein
MSDTARTAYEARYPGLVHRRPGVLDYPLRQVGSITHGGPDQYRCGYCAGTGRVGESQGRCLDCGGYSWFAS